MKRVILWMLLLASVYTYQFVFSSYRVLIHSWDLYCKQVLIPCGELDAKKLTRWNRKYLFIFSRLVCSSPYLNNFVRVLFPLFFAWFSMYFIFSQFLQHQILHWIISLYRKKLFFFKKSGSFSLHRFGQSVNWWSWTKACRFFIVAHSTSNFLLSDLRGSYGFQSVNYIFSSEHGTESR